MEIFSGTVSSVVYENEEFRIVKLMLDGSSPEPVMAKGHFPAQNVGIGSWVTFEGEWTDHPQYGRQLTVKRSPVAVATWTDDRTASALSSNGVGPSTRAAIRALALSKGKTMAELLDAGDLTEVAGLDEFGQLHTLTRWRSLRAYLDAATFMAEIGIPSSVIGRVWKTLGQDLTDVITQDPWILVRVAGIGFKEADEIAVRLGVSLENEGRIRGAVLAATQETVSEGHVFVSTGQVVAQVQGAIPGPTVTPKAIADAIRHLVEKGALKVDRTTQPGTVALYDPWYYRIETKCAELLKERLSQPLEEEFLRECLLRVCDAVRDADGPGVPLEVLASKALDNWALSHKTTLTADQMHAALRSITTQVTLLTGLPGTGKTTTLRAVVAIARDMGIPILLVAPTGIAAKRMSSVTGSDASTVHRAFGAKGFMQDDEEREATYVGVTGSTGKKSGGGNEKEAWDYGPGNFHPAKIMIVDESSMLDLHMLYRLMSATSPTCRILFVGDPYQLPSVGSGDVLRDLVNSKVFPHSHLTQIFRQEGTSGIILAAHAVHAGNTPAISPKDFALLQASTEEDAGAIVVEVAKKLYTRRLNFQVLSPRHAGEAGVTSLNQKLRVELNPPTLGITEMRLGSSVVREGDRVMVVKNDYALGVYNGDVGKVARIDRRSKEIEIKIFEGPDLPPRMVKYPFKDASRSLRLAYCQTVHKSQGQEYDIIVLPILPSFGRQLQRNLFYTAITRARQRVILVGTESAMARAVQNNQAESRNTLLARRLSVLVNPPRTEGEPAN